MVQIMIFSSWKCLQTLFLMVFHVSPWFISYKTSKYLIFLGFLKILGNNRPNYAKNGSRNLKSRYLKNIFSNRTWERKVLESWNLAKLWGKIVGKKCCNYFFDFRPHFEKNGLCMLQNRFLAPENHYLDHLWDIFLYRKYIGKSAISVIPGRTQTQISRAFSKRTIRTTSRPKLGRFIAAFGSYRSKTLNTVNFGQKMAKWTKFRHIRIFPAYRVWFSERGP